MALTSSSTYAQAVDQYLDNLSWEGDVAKARLALEAVRFLRLRRPTRSSAADGRSIDYEGLESAEAELREYLDAIDTTLRPRAVWLQGRAKM